MIKLKWLELQGFRRFKELTRITFPEAGLLLLDGDSGAGKSTVLQGIAYALGICPFPATTLKSWSGEALQVALALQQDGKTITISRGKVTSYAVEGEEPKTGSKALAEALADLFKMAPELLGAITYRPQDNFGLFLSKDDSAKKEFLGQILGLNSIEKVLDDSDALRKKLQSDFTFAQGVLAERESGLRKVLDQVGENSPEHIDPSFELRFNSTKEVLKFVESEFATIETELKAAYDRFQSESSVEKTAKRTKLEKAKSIYKELKEANEKINQNLEAQRESIRQQIQRVNQEIAHIQASVSERDRLVKEVDSLRRNECYVCRQPFTAELAIDDMDQNILLLNDKIKNMPLQQARLKTLSESLKSLVPHTDPREAKMLKVIGELDYEVQSIGKNITDTRVLAIQEAKNKKMRDLMKAKDDKSQAEENLNVYRRTAEMKAKAKARQEADKTTAVSMVDEKRAELAKIETELNAEKDFIALLGKDGFLGVIFDDVLSEISKEANDILGKLSNTSHVSVEFRSENQKGKKTIAPVFYVSGNEATRNSGLSGGMGSSADLAVDLGVISVVERRLGAAPSWLILDETFNGMPKTTKETALEILQVYAQNRLVIVVDHGTEMKAAFGTVLQIKDVDGTSVVA